MLNKHLQFPLIMVGIMALVFLVEVLLPGNFSWLGIRPRSTFGLVGIPLSPFLHADVFHLFANAVPLIVMGAMVSALNYRLFVYRTVIMIFGSGFLTWAFSSSGIVIGASSLVFAYWAYLIVNGVRTKKIKDVILSVLTVIIYGSLLISLFRHIPGVSWVGHLSGVIVGASFAWFGSRMIR